MNLRDKLNAINSRPKPQLAKPAVSGCWERQRTYPLSDFPNAFALDTDILRLMVSEDLPEYLDPRRILYLDTETTGLAGGAGTVAFEVGLGRLTDEGFVVTQLVMRDYPEERFLLQRVIDEAEKADALCTFNGKTFDLPLLRDRFLMNRIRTNCLEKPHIDLLLLSRRLWKLRLKRCSLSHLEEAILGRPRIGDLPGSEAPRRYFEYLKTKDFGLLEEVLSHNAQDIASLCVLLNHMVKIYRKPEMQADARDIFSMGSALEKEQHPVEARRCWRLCTRGAIGEQSQLRLAKSHLREGDRAEAVEIWQRMAAHRQGGTAPLIELAKHCEHRLHDYDQALKYTERALQLLTDREQLLISGEHSAAASLQAELDTIEYRYARLMKKAGARKGRPE